MKNYELINELMRYPAYCEVSVEVDRECLDTGEAVALSEGLICSELFLMEDCGEYGIALHITGTGKNGWQYAHKGAAERQMVRTDNEGRVVRNGRTDN